MSPLQRLVIHSFCSSPLKDPFEALRFEEPLADLKARLEKGEPVFQDLIRTKILENSHKARVTLTLPKGQ